MSSGAECVFCRRLAQGALLLDRPLVAAFPDGFPLSPGHTLVIPRRHEASHVSTHAADLSLIARRTTFETARARSQGIAAATYLRLPQGAMLWLQCSEFVELDRPAIELALRAA